MGENKSIVAVSTPPGSGGIAVIRVSGPDAISLLSQLWKGKAPEEFKSHSAHLGWVVDSEGNDIDQVVATYYQAPNSYTGEDIIELSCHGSPWIQKAIVNLFIEAGATAAGAGEFTKRAFENGRLDLAQAEGVADLIAASSKASARLAATQLRGDFSRNLKNLRSKLIDIGSLLELELDFSEEDVEFADRSQLIALAREILEVVSRLAESFRAGRAFKEGVPVAIAGIPNAGKSTLLNALIGEDKAIVSDIAGTTRDVIEDTVEFSGMLFRFFDTAGLRDSDDKVESIGIDRARKKISEAFLVLRLFDPSADLKEQMEVLEKTSHEADQENNCSNQKSAQLGNPRHEINVVTKQDIGETFKGEGWKELLEADNTIMISAKTGKGLDELKSMIKDSVTEDFNPEREMIVTNARHYEALLKAKAPLIRLIEGLESGVSGDFLAQDLREAEHYLGEITGEVSSTDILHTIFARYCIGK